MQRWEYRIVSLQGGRYTEALNEYGREGWELVGVAPDVQTVPHRSEGRLPPVPQAFGKIGRAASKLNELEGGGEAAGPEPGSVVTTLLWVLRRPLDDDYD